MNTRHRNILRAQKIVHAHATNKLRRTMKMLTYALGSLSKGAEIGAKAIRALAASIPTCPGTHRDG